ncbi:hypothetical protein FQN54_003199 [Arachnomyces sp. PD_36]|nr:hypothetical protein FQN54_003199 [Arachnomyces sp. PD_36]
MDVEGNSPDDYVFIERDGIKTNNGATIVPPPPSTHEIIPQSPETIARIRKWLQPTDYMAEGGEYQRHLNSFVPGTASWIEHTEEYREWHESPNYGALWIEAIAGAGKSVFAAVIASKLSEEILDDQTGEKAPVLFFFFRQIVVANHDPHTMVRDLLSQILNWSPKLQAKIKGFMDERRSIDSVAFGEFWQDLLDALVLMPRVYCVVDALDEVDVNLSEPLFGKLVELGKKKPSSIKLLMTSRRLPRIQSALSDGSVLRVRLNKTRVDEDIAIYVKHRLNCLPKIHAQIKHVIQQSMSEKSEGSFLYARLMMDQVLGQLTKTCPEDTESFEQSLRLLPATLEETYTRMLHDHAIRSGVSEDLQITILQWVTHSSRPLRLLEISDMLDFINDTSGEMEGTKATVRGACGPLLPILEDETVSVIHHSFTEFLIDPNRDERLRDGCRTKSQFRVISAPATHRLLAITCLEYISSFTTDKLSVFEVGRSSQLDTPQLLLAHPFSDYAANNLCRHVKNIPTIDNDICAKLDDFMKPDNPSFLAWLQLIQERHAPRFALPPLHVAAYGGMANYASYLIQRSDSRPDILDHLGRTPLILASLMGHDEVAAILLKQNPEMTEIRDRDGRTPLHHAAQGNHHGIVKLLLKAGANPWAERTGIVYHQSFGGDSILNGDCPLSYACRSGGVESIREMMPYLSRNDLSNALCWAAESGRPQVVDLLLTSPLALVDDPEQNFTPLFLAAFRKHFNVMDILLRHGANPNRGPTDFFIPKGPVIGWEKLAKQKKQESTAFHAISRNSRQRNFSMNQPHPKSLKDCFYLLLNAGGDFNVVDAQGNTPLHHSVRSTQNCESMVTITRLLLAHGADPTVRNNAGDTPLHSLHLHPHAADSIQALLSNGADINSKRLNDGRTPVHSLLTSIKSPNLDWLAPHVSNWNIRDSHGNTPLHVATMAQDWRVCPPSILGDLVKLGANPNLKNNKGETPLHLAMSAFRHDQSFISIFLAAGADLEARDNSGRTILLRYLCAGPLETPVTIVPPLLGFGANAKACDYQGNGALHILASWNANSELFQLLIDHGADPFHINHRGENILHVLCEEQRREDLEPFRMKCIETLLGMGFSTLATAQDYHGRTPFHNLCGEDIKKRSPYPYAEQFLNYTLESEIGEGLNIADHDGVLPIHLASSRSELLVRKLLRKGADATISTYDGNCPLHIAAMAGQCNIVGLLLDYYNLIGRQDLLDCLDNHGHTPLHIASRFGRLESLSLLLKAGADPNKEDKYARTPLHLCSQMEAEIRAGVDLNRGARYQIGVPFERKVLEIPHDLTERLPPRGAIQPPDFSEHDSLRTVEIVRLLLDYGAVAAIPSAFGSPLDVALKMGSEKVAVELMKHTNLNNQLPGSGTFMKEYMSLRSKNVGALLEETVHRGECNLGFCYQLLKLEEYEAIERLPHLGVDFSPVSKSAGLHDFLITLVSCGYSSLFEALGKSIPGLTSWVNGRPQRRDAGEKEIAPFLVTAARRELPNLEIMKVLVEKFNADVNIVISGLGLLSILITEQYWWHKMALEYLLERGADIELRDLFGQTPLHLAVTAEGPSKVYWKREIVKLLLEYGADPNAKDHSGSSCLEKAMHDTELFQTLLDHGADIYQGGHILLFAIAECNIEAIRLLLKAGVDCNVANKGYGVQRYVHIPSYVIGNLYPIHLAALSRPSRLWTPEKGVEIIKMLLENGADPYVEYAKGQPVLHEIFSTHFGFIKPFLGVSNLDLERRDSLGRTLLLTACQSDVISPAEYENTRAFAVLQRGGSLKAVDNQGDNALHRLLSNRISDLEEEYQKTLSLFLAKGWFLINQENNEGYKPIHYAIAGHREWSCHMLIAAGANPFETDPDGNSILHHVAKRSPIKSHIFPKYLALGLDINAKNNLGETPLFIYAGCGALQNIRSWPENFGIFLDAGADIFTINNKGETLLHAVVERVYEGRGLNSQYAVFELFKYVLTLGVDPMVEDRKQRTALVSLLSLNSACLGVVSD